MLCNNKSARPTDVIRAGNLQSAVGNLKTGLFILFRIK